MMVEYKSRMISDNFVYVAGLDRGFLPIGLWSTRIGLIVGPSIVEHPVGVLLVRDGTRTCSTNVLFPDPDTPVIIVSRSSGI
ncbi:MAG: hypothetical protein ACFFDP_07310, partial [Promethearchaeota archaeon]